MSRSDRQLPDDGRLPNGGWLGLVLRDLQFWVPVVVLAAGLLVLRWITATQPR